MSRFPSTSEPLYLGPSVQAFAIFGLSMSVAIALVVTVINAVCYYQ
jgi:hypothetical protein